METVKGVRRYYIDLDWNKASKRHEVAQGQQACFENKWNPFKTHWEQGFDSDCAMHCSLSDSCHAIFQDKEIAGKNHLKEIVVPMGEYPRGFEQRVEMRRVER